MASLFLAHATHLVDHPGDYATINSYQLPYGTVSLIVDPVFISVGRIRFRQTRLAPGFDYFTWTDPSP
jgi:hypothetical protein